MPSKRYYIATLPVEHMNGKLDRVAVKCHDMPDTDDSGGVSFYYGYRVGNRLQSRFGLREKSRNLSVNPYTPSETANRDLFAASVAATQAGLAIPAKHAAALAAFKRQTKYILLFNYCVAQTRANNGVFPW